MVFQLSPKIQLHSLQLETMHILRGVLDTKTAIRKLNSRSRRLPQILRPESPVISATRPLFYLLRFFGLLPFGISEDRFISRSYDVIYSLFCTLVHTYAIYDVLSRPVINKETEILDIMELARVLFNYLIVVLNILLSVWMRMEFIGVLNIVKHFDSRIRDLGHPRQEGITKIWVWVTCTCTAFVWITISRSGMIAYNEIWIDHMMYLLSYLAAFLSTIKFSGVVLLLGQRFRHLNKVARLSIECATTNQAYIAIDLKVIQQLHNNLMSAGESLSSQYEWPLLLWLMNLCVHGVNVIYFLIDWVLDPPVSTETEWLLINCLSWWLVAYVVQLLLLHIACHHTSSEANRMGSIVINLKSFAFSRNYSIESSLHLINRKLNFSAAGCFQVDLPLLRAITALITTYLVLLTQLKPKN